MKTIHTSIEDELHDRMFEAIQKISIGSTYGKARIFVCFAIEKLIERVEAGDEEAEEELRTRFAKTRKKRSG